MNKKVFEQYLYMGMGFPVLLLNVPMVAFEDDWAPDIDYERLEKRILLLLCQKPSLLKGDEVHFIRTFFGLTLQQFGDKFSVSPAGVKKWEDKGDQVTNMHEMTEKMIRLYVLDELLPREARDTTETFFRDKTKDLLDRHFIQHSADPIEIDTSSLDDAIAI